MLDCNWSSTDAFSAPSISMSLRRLFRPGSLSRGVCGLNRVQGLSPRHIYGKDSRAQSASRSLRWRSLQAGFTGRAVELAAVVSGLAAIWLLYTADPELGSSEVLDKQKFRQFTIIAKEPISPTSTIFTLRPASSKIAATSPSPYAAAWAAGLWSVEFKQPELQIARSYTPLPPPSSLDAEASPATPADLRFLIRREFKGEVSNYLNRLPLGSTIGVRGPTIDYALPPDVRDVVFLAGGTSIAPALQLIHTMFQRHHDGESDHPPRIRVLWANRRREDCVGAKPPPPQHWSFWPRRSTPPSAAEEPNDFIRGLLNLERSSNGLVTFDFLVDEEASVINTTRISAALSKSNLTSPDARLSGTKLLIVSGPEGFIQYLSGPKTLCDGADTTNPIGGQLSRLISLLDGWTVVKL